MQQLQDENQVSIFNTVYDMRHQRNFLVQSLVYNELLESQNSLKINLEFCLFVFFSL